MHGKDGQDKHTSIDTTVQEKNITYPTDAKLHKRIVDKCVEITKKESFSLRRSYSRRAKELVRATYNGGHSKQKKKANSAKRKLKTIAGRVVRELERNVTNSKYDKELSVFKSVNVK